MRSIMDCLALNIKNSRKKLGLTQSELAQKAGISLIFLQGIEAGRKWVSPQTTQVLAQALQTSESKLFENCFENSSLPKKSAKRIKKANLDHIPDDVFNALATTCKEEGWKWEAIRWIIKGYENHKQ